ncbi:MAG: protease, partial [Candidatus Kryptoniota bacterium]
MTKLEIYIPNDQTWAMPKWIEVSRFINSFDLSPDGERALFGARGDIFTVPAKEGDTRDITNTSGVDERNPVWSPNGKYVAYISDRSGEEEIYIREDKLNGTEEKLTSGNRSYIYSLVWSPDSKKILFSDSELRLRYVDVNEKEIHDVDKDSVWEIRDYSWSPDSRFITYARHHKNGFTSIYIYSLDDRKIHEVTGGFTNDFDPIFDPSGKYLIFLSDRNYNGVIGNFDMEFTDTKSTGIYVATLQADSLSPFSPKSDEVKGGAAELAKDTIKEGKQKAKGKAEEVKKVRIDFEGLGQRAVAVPIAPNNIGSLSTAAGRIYYMTYPTMGLSGNASGEEKALHSFDISAKKDQQILSPLDGYKLSFDGNKIIYKNKDSYGTIDSKPESHKPGDGAISLKQMKMFVNFHEEWAEAFN